MFTCDVCGMTTNHKDTLMRHKRGHNKANQVTCDLCGKICHHRIALRKVFEFFNPIGSGRTVRHLNKRIILKNIISKHKREVHEKNVVCHICNKEWIQNPIMFVSNVRYIVWKSLPNFALKILFKGIQCESAAGITFSLWSRARTEAPMSSLSPEIYSSWS